MKHKLRAVHSILAPIILSVGLMAMGYAFLTRPQFEDILEVTQLQVVSLSEYEKDAEVLARKAMGIADQICVFTNGNLTVEAIETD